MKINRNKYKENIISYLIQYLPVSLFLLSFIGVLCYFKLNNINNFTIYNFHLLFEILISTMITFLGFSITIITIFIGLEKTHILLKAIENETFRNQFNRYILTPIVLSLFIIFISFIIIITVDNKSTLNIYITTLLFALILYFLLSLLRLFALLFISFSSNITKNNKEKKEDIVKSDNDELNF